MTHAEKLYPQSEFQAAVDRLFDDPASKERLDEAVEEFKRTISMKRRTRR